MLISSLEYLPGKGKTEFAITKIYNLLNSNPFSKIIYTVPSIELSFSIYERLLKANVPEEYIHNVNTDTISKSVTVKEEVIRIRNSYNSLHPSIMIITSTTLQNLENIQFDEDLIIMDEELISYKKEEFDASDETVRFLLEYHLQKNILVTRLNNEYLELKLNKIPTDRNTKNIFKALELTENLLSTNKRIFIRESEYFDFINKKSDRMTFHFTTGLDHVQNAKEILFLGFNLSNTTMSYVYEKIFGYQMNQIIDVPSKYDYFKNVEIRYFSDITIGNYKIKSNPNIAEQIKDYIIRNINTNYLLSDFNTGNVRCNSTDNIVRPICHGLNKTEWMDCNTIALCSNFRLSPSETNFFKSLGYTDNQIDKSRDLNIKMQILTRSSIRVDNGINNSPIVVYVLDKRTALGLQSMIPKSKITKIKNTKVSYAKSKLKIQPCMTKTEKFRLDYLRTKKKNNPSKITKEQQNELTKLLAKQKFKRT